MYSPYWGLVFLICFGPALTLPSSTKPQDTDLEVLQHYKGTWDCEFAIESQTDKDDVKKFTGVVEGKWVVGNKFLEQTGKYSLEESSPPVIIKTMMAFDKKQNRYQYDYFISTGEVQRSFGQWDDEAKTMTSKMTDENSGSVTTFVADFSQADIERWTIETRDRDGKLTTKMAGTNTRRSGK